MYVAITSSHPLKVYVYNDIVLRFCPANYVDPVVEPEVGTPAVTDPHRVSGFRVVCLGFLGLRILPSLRYAHHAVTSPKRALGFRIVCLGFHGQECCPAKYVDPMIEPEVCTPAVTNTKRC